VLNIRKLIYLTAFLIIALNLKGFCETFVVSQSGVRVSFVRSYYNTVGYCVGGERKFDQYYVTVKVSNASGRNIYLKFCELDFGRVCLCTNSWKSNYVSTSLGVWLENGDVARGSAYMLVPEGEVPSNPGYRWDWKFGKTPFD
jgi:hypothetical protein